MNRLAKKLIAEAEDLGYVHDRTNTKGHLVYVGPNGHEVHVSPGCDEHQARSASKALRKACGTYEPPTGRNAQAVKGRQQSRRELQAERWAAEHRLKQRQRDEYLARIEKAPLLRADPAVVRRIEGYERDLARLEALMRTTPASGDHQGRRTARHTSGERAAS